MQHIYVFLCVHFWFLLEFQPFWIGFMGRVGSLGIVSYCLVKNKLSTAWNMIIPYTPQYIYIYIYQIIIPYNPQYTDDNYQIIYSNPRTNQTHQQGFSGWDSHQHIMFTETNLRGAFHNAQPQCRRIQNEHQMCSKMLDSHT